jgi:hypothetical protein
MEQLTNGPVPVGRCAGETAFAFQGCFKRMNIPPMPGKEQPCEVDLVMSEYKSHLISDSFEKV